MNEKMTAFLQDKEAVKKLLDLETDEEIQAMLATYEIDMTLAEIAQVKKAIETRFSDGDEELSDDDLENVAGGFADLITGIMDIVETIGDWINDSMNSRRRRW